MTSTGQPAVKITGREQPGEGFVARHQPCSTPAAGIATEQFLTGFSPDWHLFYHHSQTTTRTRSAVKLVKEPEMVPERSSSSYQRDHTRILAPFQAPTPLSAYFLLSILQDRATTAGSKQRRYAMSQKVLWSLGAIGCAVADAFRNLGCQPGRRPWGWRSWWRRSCRRLLRGWVAWWRGWVAWWWLWSLWGRLARPGGILRRLWLLPLVVRFRGLSVLWLLGLSQLRLQRLHL